MKILVLTGSPHGKGTTAFLADEFCEGARESGHEIIRINAAQLNIHSCSGCDHCRRNEGKCVHNDDMNQIFPHLISADAVVLVSPLYYFGITSQLKTVIDRFYSVNSILKNNRKTLHLIAAGGDSDDWIMDGVKAHFKCLCNYLHWHEGQTLYAYGLGTRKDAENSQYKKTARDMGRNC